VLFALSGEGLLQALDQSLGIRRRAQEVCGLLKSVVVDAGEQDRVAAPRGDLDRRAVAIDPLDQLEQVLTGFARGDGYESS
jgi:hypothetical protein